jgi:hypothetical protein
MKTRRLSSVLSALVTSFVLFAAGPALRADAVYYNGFANYTLTVHDESTVFNDWVNFNGAKASLGGSFSVSGEPNTGTNRVSGYVHATFQANPGYVFTGLSIAFDQWSYGNAHSFGGHGGSGSWTVPGSTYVGDINPVDPGASSMAWSGSGDSGGWSYYRYVWWDGGGGQFQSLMGPHGTYPIQLDYVSSFTLMLNLALFAENNSGYGTSSLGLGTFITGAPPPVDPPVAAVPEGPLSAGLLGAVLFGTMLLGRRAHGTARAVA